MEACAPVNNVRTQFQNRTERTLPSGARAHNTGVAAAAGGPVPEIRRNYHEQLDELKRGVVRLGALATEAIGAGTQALLDADLAAADRVIGADIFLDDLT